MLQSKGCLCSPALFWLGCTKVAKRSSTALKYRAREVCDRHFSALVQSTLPKILYIDGLQTMSGHGMCRFFTLPNLVVAIACPDFYKCCILFLNSFLKFFWAFWLLLQLSRFLQTALKDILKLIY